MTEETQQPWAATIPPTDGNVCLGVISRNRAATFRHEARRFSFPNALSDTQVTNWEIGEGVALALVFSTGQQHELLGSGVLVGPGLALSASHTVIDFIPRINSGTVTVTAFGVTRDKGLRGYRVRRGTMIDGTDVSVLLMELITEYREPDVIPVATMSTRLPALGETLYCLGFIADKPVFSQTRPDVPELGATFRLTSGPLLQVFHPQRDRVVAKWPCMEIDAPLYGCMSGGPVIDSRGCLVGLGARSPNLGEGAEPSPMIASLLWPVLPARFEVGPDGKTDLRSLLDLNGAYTVIERPEALQVSYGPGNIMHINYDSWS